MSKPAPRPSSVQLPHSVSYLKTRRGRLARAAAKAVEPLEARTLFTATPLYWDPTGASTAAGGAGTWNTTALEWRSGSPTGSLVAWANAGDANGPYKAVFSAGSGTVTIGVGVTASSVSFTASGYTLAGSAALSFSGGTGQVDVASGLSETISAPIAGANGLTKTSAGTLTLGGADTYSGVTVVSAGTVNVTGNESGATGGWAIGTTNAAASTVNLQAGSTIVVAGSGSIQVGGTVASTGTATATLNVAGSVTNGGTLLDGRAGVINLNSGGNWVQNGSMSVVGQGGYGAALAVNAGASLTYAGASAITVNPGNSGGAASVTVTGGALTTSAGF